MNIGNKIKELRVKNKVTQEELAKALQVSTQAVLQNPQIVGLIAMLDMVVNKPNTYCYYCGGPNNYFKR